MSETKKNDAREEITEKRQAAKEVLEVSLIPAAGCRRTLFRLFSCIVDSVAKVKPSPLAKSFCIIWGHVPALRLAVNVVMLSVGRAFYPLFRHFL